MTNRNFRSLREGDIVIKNGSANSFRVGGNYGNRVTVVRIVDVNNPHEWAGENAPLQSIVELKPGDYVIKFTDKVFITEVHEDKFGGHATGVVTYEINKENMKDWNVVHPQSLL